MKHAGAVYWAFFVSAFLAVAIWESFRQARPLTWPAGQRWWRHGVLLAVSDLAVAGMVRASPIAVAAAVAGSRFGILNHSWLPRPVQWAATLVILDFTSYVVHRTFHSFGVLWRVHEVHHSDPDFDVSTGARFHPLEVIATQAVYLSVVALLAPPAGAVFAAELLSLTVNFFVHANASLPGWVERALRTVLITPGLHRIHHSADVADHSRNYGQTFSWWDRVFGTYLEQPAAGEQGLITGVEGLRTYASIGLLFMIAEPFRGSNQEGNPASSGRVRV